MLHHLAAMSVPNMAATPSTLRRPAVLVQSPLMRCTCPKVTSDNISIITIYPRACLFVCLFGWSTYVWSVKNSRDCMASRSWLCTRSLTGVATAPLLSETTTSTFSPTPSHQYSDDQGPARKNQNRRVNLGPCSTSENTHGRSLQKLQTHGLSWVISRIFKGWDGPGQIAPRWFVGKPARMVEFGRIKAVYCLYTK